VAVAMTMAQMKIAVLRHTFRGARKEMAFTGAGLGIVLAGGTVYLSLLSPELLAAAYAVWMMGWVLGPVFMGGGDETLRPEYFASIGLPARRMATGLLAAAFVGLPPLISLVALGGLLVQGGRLGLVNALVAVPATVLQLAVFVLLAKVCVAVIGIALRSRLGAVASGLINGAILASLGQGWVFFVVFGTKGVPGAVWYLPSAWGLLAVRGHWWALGALAGLVLGLLGVWAALLSRRTGATRVSGRSRGALPATGAGGAVVGRELRTWSRDLVRNHQSAFALAYGVWFAASPLLLGWNGMLAYAGPIFIVMAAAMAANLYATDGTAFWLTLMTPNGSDVRGRQLAWLAVHGGPAVGLTVGLTAIVGGPWALVLALLPALLGGAAGLIPLVAVYALVPGTDPHKRAGNPLRTTEDEGAMTGRAYLMLALVLLSAVPAGLVAVFFGWAGVPVGLVTGVLCFWGLGRLAERRLHSYGPELLEMMRTGHKPARPGGGSPWLDPNRFAHLSRARRSLVGGLFGFAAIPLFPQGIVGLIFVATGEVDRSWFLASYLPSGLRYPVAIGFIVLGVAMYAAALWLIRPPRRAEAVAADSYA
jgi:ABC-2 type transport system permease protein